MSHPRLKSTEIVVLELHARGGAHVVTCIEEALAWARFYGVPVSVEHNGRTFLAKPSDNARDVIEAWREEASFRIREAAKEVDRMRADLAAAEQREEHLRNSLKNGPS